MILGRLLRSRPRRWVAVASVVAIAIGALVAVQVATAPVAVQPDNLTVSVPGGPGESETIALDASLYVPTVTPAPAVIVAHGFGGSKKSVVDDAERLVAAGFVVLTYSARGFGNSTGRIALDSLDYEVADARALVDWLAKQPEVAQDGPNDPRVGVTGGSYGGALSLMLAGTDPRVDAVAAVETWNNLEQALFPNNIGRVTVGSNPPSPSAAGVAPTPAFVPAAADGVFKQAWTAALMSSILAAGPGAGTANENDASPGGPADNPPGNSSGRDGPNGSGISPVADACGRLMPQLCAAYLQVAESGRISSAMTALLTRSSPAQVVSKITAPTLLLQGEQDTLFGLDQADANAREIAAAGTPVAVGWYPGGHSGGGLDGQSQDRITDWFRYYLAGHGSKPSRSFQYAVAGPVSQRGTPRVRTLELPDYPGLDRTTTPEHSIGLRGPAQTIVNPPGGQPAAITSLPGVGSLASGALGGLTAMPGQTALFVSKILAAPIVVTGSATLRLNVARIPTPSPDPHADHSAVLFLSLVAANPASTNDVAGDTTGSDSSSGGGLTTGGASPAGQSGLGGIAAMLGSGPAGGAVAPIRIPDLPADGTPVTVTVHLPAVAFQVAAGKALGVRVATTDQGFPASTFPAAYRVSLSGAGSGGAFTGAAGGIGATTGNVLVPEAGGVRINNDESPVGWAIALGAILLLGFAALVLVGRSRNEPRRRSRATGADSVIPSDAEPPPPLVVTGLKKVYPGGVTAVDDVSFTVRRGEVLGLLGPNGAGKTTTLRMVMGLISSSAGDIRLFGEPVSPGTPVLARVGSFVEGSGFLPHLSGKANLDLYWRGTGRPASDSYMAEALAIAGLGDAIKRKVRTYSQGMRQRLAIAQAMLGLPDLLILDEPTNGLDPPQIHAMREVLRRYAATGRTVVVSSHLLSEVEQTCSDVVIVSEGRTIAAGTVGEMVSHSSDLLVSTSEPDAARHALARLTGLGEIEAAPGGIAVDRGTVSVTVLMRALIDGDVPVTAIAPRNRLEEVFLDLIAAGSMRSKDGRAEEGHAEGGQPPHNSAANGTAVRTSP
ncbi:MAG: alpha/beta fold hydrolase [Nakamurella sp.]